MLCQKTTIWLKNNMLSLLLCLLGGFAAVPALAKDDILQSIEKMEKCLRSKKTNMSPADKHAWATWDDFKKNASLTLEKFVDTQKFPTHSFSAQIDLYKGDLERCHKLMAHAFFAPICSMLQELHKELHALVKVVEPYSGATDWRQMILVGAKIKKFEYLLPKDLRSKGLFEALKHRIKMNGA